MQTSKKAKEIFNIQINKPVNENTFSLKKPTGSLQKIHSIKPLYKLYLYNKMLKKGLKKLSLFKLFKTSKVKNSFYRVLFQVNKLSIPIKKQRIILLINTILAKIAFSKNINFKLGKFTFSKNINFKNLKIKDIKFNIFKRSFTKSTYKEELKRILILLDDDLFTKFFEYEIAYFEYKIVYLSKAKKQFSSFKKELNIFLNDLRTSKKFIDVEIRLKNVEIRLKNFLFKLITSFRKLFINFRWSNKLVNKLVNDLMQRTKLVFRSKLVNDLMQRTKLVFGIYSMAFLVILCNGFCCLSEYDYFKDRLANLLYLDRNVLHAFIQTFRNYSQIFSIFYMSLFLKPKNSFIRLPKNTIGHLGFCTVMSFIIFGLELGQFLINYLVKAGVLITDIYVSRFLIRSDKKRKFLRKITDFFTTGTALVDYRNAKRYRPVILFNLEGNHLIGDYITPYYVKGLYESFIEYILYEAGVSLLYEGSGKFVKSYIYLPFYLILLTTLLYNCSYYIIYNKQPYLPIVTDMVETLTPKYSND